VLYLFSKEGHNIYKQHIYGREMARLSWCSVCVELHAYKLRETTEEKNNERDLVDHVLGEP